MRGIQEPNLLRTWLKAALKYTAHQKPIQFSIFRTLRTTSVQENFHFTVVHHVIHPYNAYRQSKFEHQARHIFQRIYRFFFSLSRPPGTPRAHL